MPRFVVLPLPDTLTLGPVFHPFSFPFLFPSQPLPLSEAGLDPFISFYCFLFSDFSGVPYPRVSLASSLSPSSPLPPTPFQYSSTMHYPCFMFNHFSPSPSPQPSHSCPSPSVFPPPFTLLHCIVKPTPQVPGQSQRIYECNFSSY